MLTRELTIEECEVVERYKVNGFGAYLQNERDVKEDPDRRLGKGELPSNNFLTKRAYEMIHYTSIFDLEYLEELPGEEVNPLLEEQEAWKSLSPDIKYFLGRFGSYLHDYDENDKSDENKKALVEIVDEWWELLQIWNQISDMYKSKLEAAYEISYGEEKLEELMFGEDV